MAAASLHACGPCSTLFSVGAKSGLAELAEGGPQGPYYLPVILFGQHQHQDFVIPLPSSPSLPPGLRIWRTCL